MLYFKTKKGRLIIELIIDSEGPFQNLYIVIPTPKEGRLPAYHYKWIDERVWKCFEKMATPVKLEDNEQDLATYNEVIALRDEFEQEMADQDWMYAKACEFYGTNKKL